MGFPRHDALRDYTGFLLRRVATATFDRFAHVAAQHGIHPMHFGMLVIIDSDGPVSQTELVRRTGVDASTMVARVDALEQLGLVERQRSSEDRRSNELRLTPKGKKTLESMQADAQIVADEVFGALTAAERKQFHALLEKLAASLDT
jgi:MarR family transcriptional regulator, lower aerobic nicotinate degradation pathway regulator